MLTSNSSTSKYVDPKDTLIPADINAVSWVIQALDVDQDTFCNKESITTSYIHFPHLQIEFFATCFENFRRWDGSPDCWRNRHKNISPVGCRANECLTWVL
mmetsp:Transcript_9212/g.11051  ORF Transcript_9212/g.11051 Transcript_9212/m.11051 type:complete len:101 (+) Transcript_9212:1040-1342(+)